MSLISPRPSCLALLCLLLALASAGTVEAGFGAFTKTCVDLNGDQLCEGDWVRCTLHIEVVGSEETFNLTDVVPGTFFAEFRAVTEAPPPAGSCHLNEGVPLGGDPGVFCQELVVMAAGTAFDFEYEALVAANTFGQATCGFARIRTLNLFEGNSNEVCLTYDCVVPGTPNTLLEKEWVSAGPQVFGTPVRFELRMTNAGEADDTNVRLVDMVDPLRFTAPTFSYSRPPDSGGAVGHDLDATWDVLALGETITVTIDTVYAYCAFAPMDVICNQATVFSDGITLIEADGFRLSDDPSTPARYGDRTCRQGSGGGSALLQDPALKEMIDENGLPTVVGDFVTVRITFQNDSPCSPASGVLSDTLDPGVEFVPGSIVVTPDSGTTSYDAGTNTVGVSGFEAVPGTTTIEFRVQVVDLSAGSVCNTATYRFGITLDSATNEVCLGFVDSDGDSIEDSADNCPGVPNGPAEDNQADADGDGAGDACDLCAGFDDGLDGDGDAVPDGCDVCPGFDDAADADSDTVADGCDVCAGFDDLADTDADSVPDGCDVCAGFDDLADADSDGIADGCDVCAGFDDGVDVDADTVPDGCDTCPGFDDLADSDADTVPDGCDVCVGFDDLADGDGDTVADGCDNCPGVANGPAEDGQADVDGDLAGDACDPCPADPDDACARVDVLRNAELDGSSFNLHDTVLTAGADPRLDAVADLDTSDVFSLPEVVMAGDAVTVGLGNPGVLVFYELTNWPGRLAVAKRGADVVLSGWP